MDSSMSAYSGDSSEDYEFVTSAKRRVDRRAGPRQTKYPRVDWDALDYFESDEETNFLRSLNNKRGRKGGRQGRRERVVLQESESPDDAFPMDETTSTSSISSHKENEVVEYRQYENPSAAIETVIDHRWGRVGATGDATTSYNCMFEGDPNEGGEGESREFQYLIKWKGLAYIHSTWETEESLKMGDIAGLQRIKNYNTKRRQREAIRRNSDRETVEHMDCEEDLRLDLVSQCRKLERIICDVTDEYLCKWCALPYADCTYELTSLIDRLFPEIVADFRERKNCVRLPSPLCKVLLHRPRFVPLASQPGFLSSKERLVLRDYQLEGINWLLFGWCRNTAGILADEMGLGKTVQVISFLNYLFNTYSLHGPFMIIVPLSTIESWKREFRAWSPEMNTICYTGDIGSREKIREYEWWFGDRIKFNVLLTTYEILLKDDTYLSDINWACLIVDEAHRLKNDESILYKTLISYNTNHRILMSGTPLQNTLRELWALLAFLNPYSYCEWPVFQSMYSSNNTYERLHDELKPILLRRMKQDVEKSLPAKVERILRVELSALQKQYYKWIVTRNFAELTKGASKKSFLNIMMELQKCCNHAFLVKEESRADLAKLIRGSGKFILLDQLLTRLKDNGHRVLIFSQMVRILDLLSRYMVLKGFQFQRLDGTIRGEVRKQAMDHFNADNSPDFCFLLSTRAGGLGLNLATADTVIIFDSDWNPQNDLQAQARAHRIGQTKQVTIYRLVSKNTVEQSIIERAKKKMVLDHLVIQRMDTSGKAMVGDASRDYTKEDLSAILAFGAESLFREKEGDEREPNVDIDEILNLAESSGVQPQSQSDDALLSQFKIVNFNYTEDDQSGEDQKKSWDEIIPLSYRNRVFNTEEVERIEPTVRNSARHAPENDEVDSEDSDVPRRKKKSSFGNSMMTKTEMTRFVRSFRKFPDPLERIDDIMVDACLSLVSLSGLRRLANEMYRRCCDTYRQCSGKYSSKKTPIFIKMCSAQINVKLVLEAVNNLQPLTRMAALDASDRERLMQEFTNSKHFLGKEWTPETDWNVLTGVTKHGLNNWQAMKGDEALDLADRLSPLTDSKTPYKPYSFRVEQLLKILKNFDNEEASPPKKAAKKKSVPPKEVRNSHPTMTLRSGRTAEVSEDGIGQDDTGRLSGSVFSKCKEKFRSHKMKLKTLVDLTTEMMSGDGEASGVLQNLREIGDHIESFIGEGEEEWKSNYWKFVSLFTSIPPARLEEYYYSRARVE